MKKAKNRGIKNNNSFMNGIFKKTSQKKKGKDIFTSKNIFT